MFPWVSFPNIDNDRQGIFTVHTKWYPDIYWNTARYITHTLEFPNKDNDRQQGIFTRHTKWYAQDKPCFFEILQPNIFVYLPSTIHERGNKDKFQSLIQMTAILKRAKDQIRSKIQFILQAKLSIEMRTWLFVQSQNCSHLKITDPPFCNINTTSIQQSEDSNMFTVDKQYN